MCMPLVFTQVLLSLPCIKQHDLLAFEEALTKTGSPKEQKQYMKSLLLLATGNKLRALVAQKSVNVITNVSSKHLWLDWQLCDAFCFLFQPSITLLACFNYNFSKASQHSQRCRNQSWWGGCYWPGSHIMMYMCWFLVQKWDQLKEGNIYRGIWWGKRPFFGQSSTVLLQWFTLTSYIS